MPIGNLNRPRFPAALSTFKHDLTDQRFGRLVAVRPFRDSRSNAIWECLCDCGNTTFPYAQSLFMGHTRSCGCISVEVCGNRARTHGQHKSITYSVWRAILKRCHDPNCSSYPFYGARGITVYDKWRQSFESFLADMGKRPSLEYQIDRKNNDKGYAPDNCRWVTKIEQQRNKRRTPFLTLNGETKALTEWSEILNIKSITLHKRRQNGWTDEQILTTPVSRRNNHLKFKRQGLSP